MLTARNMELNPVFSTEISEDYPPLIDPILEEVGETKLDIQRVRNRVNVIKSFYQHMRNSQSHVVRRELEDKVNAEVEIIMMSLSKIQNTLRKWENKTDGMKLSNIVEMLKEVLREYEQVLNDHRNANITELKLLLKATSDKDDGNSLLAVNQNFQNHLRALNEQNHIEIEERYSEMLRTDIALRNLKTKFSHLIATNDYSESAVLEISNFMDSISDFEDQKKISPIFKASLLVGLLALSCMFIIIVLYLLL